MHVWVKNICIYINNMQESLQGKALYFVITDKFISNYLQFVKGWTTTIDVRIVGLY